MAQKDKGEEPQGPCPLKEQGGRKGRGAQNEKGAPLGDGETDLAPDSRMKLQHYEVLVFKKEMDIQ